MKITRRINKPASLILSALAFLPILAGCNTSGINDPAPVPAPTSTTSTTSASPTKPRPTATTEAFLPSTDTPEKPRPTSTIATTAPRKPTTTPTSNPVRPIDTALQFGAYFIEWGVYSRDYVPADIPANQLNTIYYAFISPDDLDNDGLFECVFYDSQAALDEPISRLVPGTDEPASENLGMINQLAVLKRTHPNLRVMMSVGGAGDSDNFPRIASNEGQRKHFAKSCIDLMGASHFDGIDIDWEFPEAADRDDFTDLLQTFRDELDRFGADTGAQYPLSIAAPIYEDYLDAIDIPNIAPIVSWANLMAYDFYGGWESSTGHGAPLCPTAQDPHGPNYNGSAGVRLWIDGGMPPSKINLGLPYYGTGFQHLQSRGLDKNLPGKFADITPEDYVYGTWDKTESVSPASSFDYWDIAERFAGAFVPSTEPLDALNNYTRYWDDEQGMPFLSTPDAFRQSGDGLWLTYDDPQSLARKVQYARTQGLGGVFVWELSQERKPGTATHPLTDAITAAINAPLDPVSCEPAR